MFNSLAVIELLFWLQNPPILTSSQTRKEIIAVFQVRRTSCANGCNQWRM